MSKELKVDVTKCIGCGQCVAMFPENFDFDAETGLSTPISSDNLVDDMTDICPVHAISFVDGESAQIIEFPTKEENEDESEEEAA